VAQRLTTTYPGDNEGANPDGPLLVFKTSDGGISMENSSLIDEQNNIIDNKTKLRIITHFHKFITMAADSIPNATSESYSKELASQYTIADLRAMKPLGKSIPDCPETELSTFVYTVKVVDKAPEPEEKARGRFSRFKEKLKATRPAQRAYEKADVEIVEGHYYSLSPEGEVLETTITRRGMLSKTEMIFGVVDMSYMTKYGRRNPNY
jgi:hypothetical protein